MESGDATRRTRLAGERTQLAWWRTGLFAYGNLRGRALDDAVAHGGYAQLGRRANLALALGGIVLGVATCLLILFG